MRCMCENNYLRAVCFLLSPSLNALNSCMSKGNVQETAAPSDSLLKVGVFRNQICVFSYSLQLVLKMGLVNNYCQVHNKTAASRIFLYNSHVCSFSFFFYLYFFKYDDIIIDHISPALGINNSQRVLVWTTRPQQRPILFNYFEGMQLFLSFYHTFIGYFNFRDITTMQCVIKWYLWFLYNNESKRKGTC